MREVRTALELFRKQVDEVEVEAQAIVLSVELVIKATTKRAVNRKGKEEAIEEFLKPILIRYICYRFAEKGGASICRSCLVCQGLCKRKAQNNLLNGA